MSRGRDRRPAPRAPPKARTRAYRLRDAAPDRMSAADWPGQNSSPKAEADGQDAAPSSRQTTPSAAMAPGGHAVPATLLCPGSANPLVPAERVTCNHGNAAAPPRACVLRHPSQAVSWAERAEAGAWGRGLGRSRGGALAWGGAWKAGPGVCGRGRSGRQSPVCGPRLCGLRSRGRVPLGPCRQVPGLAPDPEPHTVTHPCPFQGLGMFCGPSTVVYNGSTSRREGRTTRGVSGRVCRPRERRLPCPPLPPLRMLTWSDLGRFDAPFIKRKKRKEIFVRILVNSFLFCTAVC